MSFLELVGICFIGAVALAIIRKAYRTLKANIALKKLAKEQKIAQNNSVNVLSDTDKK